MNSRASRTAPPGQGFSLVETIIVLTILVLLSAASVPMFQGIQAERAAREPLSAIVNYAKAARFEAIKNKRPYQLAFTQNAIYFTRYYGPQITLLDLEQIRLEAEAAKVDRQEAFEAQFENETPAEKLRDKGQISVKEFCSVLTYREGASTSVQYWHEAAPTPIEGDIVKLWVFQPTGICDPIKLTLSHGKAAFAVEFSALTVDIVKEVSTY